MGIQAKLTLWLLSLAAVLGVLFGVFQYGKHVQRLEDGQTAFVAQKQEVQAGNAQNDADAKRAQKNEEGRQRQEKVDRGVAQQIAVAATKPQYQECRLTPADFGLLNQAITGEVSDVRESGKTTN